MSGPVLISTGGTGGHVFPALATARALRARGQRVAFLTDRRGARYLRGENEVYEIPAASPSGGPGRRLGALWAIARGTWRSHRLIGRLRPSAAAAFGGYAAVPAVLAAALARLPVLLHEQNAVLGRANRLASRFARTLALTFADTEGVPPVLAARSLVTGNPIRPDFGAAEARSPGGGEDFRLLVLGGSQGARVFGEVVPEAVARLPAELRRRLRLALQCRPEELAAVEERCTRLGVEAELATFFEDVAGRLAAADLVIGRAGASTIAELLHLARPAVFVPYPHAADDHQRANAERLVRAGAARMLPEDRFTAPRLAETLTELARDPAALAAMSEAAARLAVADAADRLAGAVLAMIEGEDGR